MTEPTILVVDCDPGVDDALALAWLATQERAGRCRVDLVTTVAGNVSGRETARNAVKVAAAVGLGCPVHAGCDRPLARPELPRPTDVHGADGLLGLADADAGEPESREGVVELVGAVRGLAEESRPPVLLAQGPLTNVAAALAIEPALPTLVERLVVMGGAFGPVKGNATPWAEFNFAFDPEAARAVCHAGFPIAVVPLDVTRQVVVTADDFDAFDARGCAPFVADLLEAMVGSRRSSGGPDGTYVHDALAAMAALRPDVVSTEPLIVDVLTQNPEAGHSIGRRRHAHDPADTTMVDVAFGVDAGRARSLLLAGLAGSLD